MTNWKEHQLFVMETLSDLKDNTETILKKLHEQDKEIDRLKFKSGLWGLIGGFLSGLSTKFGTWFLN